MSNTQSDLNSSRYFLPMKHRIVNTLRHAKHLPVSCILIALAGCATQSQKAFPPPTDYVPIDKIEITSKFATIELTQETLAAEINKCIPQLSAGSDAVKKQTPEFPSKSIILFGHVSSANHFWLNKTTGICLQTSAAKFPILAAEAFLLTANPMGVPPDISDRWYKQMALLIASKGSTKVAYQFQNGNAFIVDYWLEPLQVHKLYYSSSFQKAGTWEAGKFDLRLTHSSMSSVSETKRNGHTVKTNLLMHRLP